MYIQIFYQLFCYKPLCGMMLVFDINFLNKLFSLKHQNKTNCKNGKYFIKTNRKKLTSKEPIQPPHKTYVPNMG